MKLKRDILYEMKFIYFPIIFLISSCAPSPSAVQTSIAKTQAAYTPTLTNTPTATSTLQPTKTPKPTMTPDVQWSHCILGKSMTPQYYGKLLLQRTCIYGVITKKDVLDTGDVIYNIFPMDKPATFLIVVREPSTLEETFPNAVGILTTADVGDCIIVIGYPARFEDWGTQFLGVDVRDIPQLVSELGTNNQTVLEITGFCK